MLLTVVHFYLTCECGVILIINFVCACRSAALSGELEALRGAINDLEERKRQLETDLEQAKHRASHENRRSCSSSNINAVDRLQEELDRVNEKLQQLGKAAKVQEAAILLEQQQRGEHGGRVVARANLLEAETLENNTVGECVDDNYGDLESSASREWDPCELEQRITQLSAEAEVLREERDLAVAQVAQLRYEKQPSQRTLHEVQDLADEALADKHSMDSESADILVANFNQSGRNICFEFYYCVFNYCFAMCAAAPVDSTSAAPCRSASSRRKRVNNVPTVKGTQARKRARMTAESAAAASSAHDSSNDVTDSSSDDSSSSEDGRIEPLSLPTGSFIGALQCITFEAYQDPEAWMEKVAAGLGTSLQRDYAKETYVCIINELIEWTDSQLDELRKPAKGTSNCPWLVDESSIPAVDNARMLQCFCAKSALRVVKKAAQVITERGVAAKRNRFFHVGSFSCCSSCIQRAVRDSKTASAFYEATMEYIFSVTMATQGTPNTKTRGPVSAGKS